MLVSLFDWVPCEETRIMLPTNVKVCVHSTCIGMYIHPCTCVKDVNIMYVRNQQYTAVFMCTLITVFSSFSHSPCFLFFLVFFSAFFVLSLAPSHSFCFFLEPPFPFLPACLIFLPSDTLVAKNKTNQTSITMFCTAPLITEEHIYLTQEY